MIDIGYIGSPVGEAPAVGGLSSAAPARKAGGPAGTDGGFLGLLLAVFARPGGPDPVYMAAGVTDRMVPGRQSAVPGGAGEAVSSLKNGGGVMHGNFTFDSCGASSEVAVNQLAPIASVGMRPVLNGAGESFPVQTSEGIHIEAGPEASSDQAPANQDVTVPAYDDRPAAGPGTVQAKAQAIPGGMLQDFTLWVPQPAGGVLSEVAAGPGYAPPSAARITEAFAPSMASLDAFSMNSTSGDMATGAGATIRPPAFGPMPGAMSDIGQAPAGSRAANPAKPVKSYGMQTEDTLSTRIPRAYVSRYATPDRVDGILAGGFPDENAALGRVCRTGEFAGFARPETGFDAAAARFVEGHSTQILPGLQVQGAPTAVNTGGSGEMGARGGAMMASLPRMTSADGAEPASAGYDFENAFVFNAPQQTVFSDGEGAPSGEATAGAVVSRICDETLEARAAGKTSLSFEVTTETGETVRVRIAIRSNVVSGRIGVVSAETREVLALHIPELNQRLEMDNLIPERFDVYLMGGEGGGGRRGGHRRAGHTTRPPDEQTVDDDFIYVSNESRTFEKWA